MGGLLVPEHYRNDLPDASGMTLASVIWGLSLGIAILNCDKAVRQTRQCYRRRKRLSAYTILCWLEIVSSLALGTLCWLYLRSVIQPSFQYFFCISLLWSTQVQCLIQIIANRVGLLMTPRSRATRLKWICFGILLAINISVIVIWVPARLQINQRFVDINKIWDRVEKVLYAIMDAGLNIYFMYTVKRHLIMNGLRKYTLLYRVNLVLAVISISLDILLIAIMSLPNDYVYLQFHPVAYLLKLQIEMNMADLIGKVARSTEELNSFHSPPQTVPRAPFSRTSPKKHNSIVFGDELMLSDESATGESKESILCGDIGCQGQADVCNFDFVSVKHVERV